MRIICSAIFVCGLIFPFTSAAELVVDYSLSIPQPQTHLFHVGVQIRGHQEASLELSMPVWSTGAYWVVDFAGSVTMFEAKSTSGGHLESKKIDKNTWKIDTQGVESIYVEYVVYARSPSITRSFVNSRTGHILGSSLFMFVNDLTGHPVSLKLNLPSGWRVANGAVPTPGDSHLFRFASYDQMIDTPMLIGNFRQYSFDVGGVPHLVAIAGESDMDHQEFVTGARKLVEAGHSLFGGLPYEKYCFILFMSPRGGGGLEHHNGTTMGSRSWGFAHDPKRIERLLDLTSHEYFHTWNVKNLQPHVFKPYNYETETETGFLWFSEGVTEYYTDQLLLRAGLYTSATVLKNLAELIAETRRTPGRLQKSAYDSSFDTWITPRDENRANATISYYPKGEIAGLIIDLEIIQRSGGKKSFDDVLLAMWKAYRQDNAGFDTEEIRKLCEQVAGGSFEEIFADFVYGVKEVPFEDIVRRAGYELIVDEEKMGKERQGAYLGARYAESSGQVKITTVLRDTEAWKDGLNYDDEVISAGGVRISSVKDLDLQLKARKPGDEITFLVGRMGLVEELKVTLEDFPVPIYKIVEIKDPTEQQLEIRKKWFER